MAPGRSRRNLIGELVACTEAEDGGEELDRLLAGHLPALAEALSSTPREVLGACGQPEEIRRQRVRELVKLGRERAANRHASAMRNLALAAAGMLGRLAKWTEEGVELDPRIILGTLLSDRTRTFIRLELADLKHVEVARSKLRDASRALRFQDLRCYVTDRGLEFRWRGGVGRLLLTSQQRDHATDGVLVVVIGRPELPARSAAERPSRTPAWIGDVIAALGFP
jgi:hypothetical protein